MKNTLNKHLKHLESLYFIVKIKDYCSYYNILIYL